MISIFFGFSLSYLQIEIVNETMSMPVNSDQVFVFDPVFNGMRCYVMFADSVMGSSNYVSDGLYRYNFNESAFTYQNFYFTINSGSNITITRLDSYTYLYFWIENRSKENICGDYPMSITGGTSVVLSYATDTYRTECAFMPTTSKADARVDFGYGSVVQFISYLFYRSEGKTDYYSTSYRLTIDMKDPFYFLFVSSPYVPFNFARSREITQLSNFESCGYSFFIGFNGGRQRLMDYSYNAITWRCKSFQYQSWVRMLGVMIAVVLIFFIVIIMALTCYCCGFWKKYCSCGKLSDTGSYDLSSESSIESQDHPYVPSYSIINSPASQQNSDNFYQKTPCYPTQTNYVPGAIEEHVPNENTENPYSPQCCQ